MTLAMYGIPPMCVVNVTIAELLLAAVEARDDHLSLSALGPDDALHDHVPALGPLADGCADQLFERATEDLATPSGLAAT